ncbi:nucleotidyl transferase AbiEii/AbiGii toxin family protein [Trichloromonas sp.]|uniref:nucleotidyl transferase AbiEii/AbiGii toxin family protein n=1 Tax=Trichloromonas sp. TaxID=3069249 RepID=UPI003D8131B8
MKNPKDTASSVRHRLLSRARIDQRPFNELLQYYAMERFLYRLSQSVHADRFILKGALMLRAWRSPGVRPTMDIDFLGRTSNEEGIIAAQFRDIIAVAVAPDGLVFDPASLQTERITEDADYEGIRVRFRGTLDSARIHMQIDIGFGDVVFPGPEMSDLPTLLDSPGPRLLCYSRESAIAEKFEAMVKLGELNSRMKDFYDIWLLSRQFDFSGDNMAEAIRLTFERRETALPGIVTAFRDEFVMMKQIQWTAFHRRLRQAHIPENFADVVHAIKDFIEPLVVALSSRVAIPANWVAPGPWQ